MNVKSKSRTIHGLLANRSISESDQRRALMMPQELMQMPKGDLLLMRGGIPPVRGRKIEYFRRSEEHTSELQSLMRISYAVFCLKKKTLKNNQHHLVVSLRASITFQNLKD